MIEQEYDGMAIIEPFDCDLFFIEYGELP